MRKTKLSATFIATAGLLAGCGSGLWMNSYDADAPRIPRDAKIYACDGGKRLVVRYAEDGKSAMIIYPDREFRLDSMPAGSGMKYGNGRTTLSTGGGEAMLEEGGATLFAICKVPPASQPAAAPVPGAV
jgi:membrane-bound inhibitor of C-type lysozyme